MMWWQIFLRYISLLYLAVPIETALPLSSSPLSSYFSLENVQSAFPLEHFPQNLSTLRNPEISGGKYSSRR